MSTKIKSIAVTGARVLLGLIYFIFGLNFFLNFIPNDQKLSAEAGTFLGGLFTAGYLFPFMKTVEVVLGALLLARLFVPLSLVLLAPITLNIFLFHAFLEPASGGIAYLILALNIYLLWAYRDYFKPLLNVKSPVTLQ
jgi:putative oxidoreductase